MHSSKNAVQRSPALSFYLMI